MGFVRAEVHDVRVHELRDDHVLALFHLMAVQNTHGLEEFQVRDFGFVHVLMLQCVDEVLDEAFVDFIYQY